MEFECSCGDLSLSRTQGKLDELNTHLIYNFKHLNEKSLVSPLVKLLPTYVCLTNLI